MDETEAYPPFCGKCGGVRFEQVGYGLWDGKHASGVFTKAKCLKCGVVWCGSWTQDEAERNAEPRWVECTW